MITDEAAFRPVRHANRVPALPRQKLRNFKAADG
jgi:hypothetical protein